MEIFLLFGINCKSFGGELLSCRRFSFTYSGFSADAAFSGAQVSYLGTELVLTTLNESWAADAVFSGDH